jgi:sensor histidine kinase YesM
MAQMRELPPPFVFAPIFVPSVLILFFMIGIALRTTLRWYDEDRKNKQISAEQLKTELAFLKNQISPHFFFNTLNNIYALTESDPEQAKEITYKLSKLMRYLLYDSDKTKSVSLEMEISFLENYIALMRPRLTENVKVVTKFESVRIKDQIPPLLFITFLENAFKHGISSNKLSFIDISLQNVEGRVMFKIKNSIPPSENLEKGMGGLGLVNIKRRLELLFDKDVYSLKIDETNESYSVELNIPVNEN